MHDYNSFIEIALGKEYSGFWLPAGPGVYSTRLFVDHNQIPYGFGYGSFLYGDYKSTGTVTTTIGDRKQYVASVFIGDEFYLPVLQKEEMFGIPKSFLYDSANQVLYLRVENNAHPDTIEAGTLILGYTNRFSDKEMVFEINNQYEYIPSRIKRWGPLRRERDPMFFKTIVFDSADIEMFNEDGGLDHFHEQDYYGQTVYIKWGRSDRLYEDYKTIYAGNVGNISYKKDTLKLTLDDPRKQLSRKLPPNKLFPSEYPHIGSNEGIGKPIVYGRVRKAKCICLNEDETDPTYYTFMFADTSVHNVQSLGTVYGNQSPVSIHDSNLAAGTFRIARSTLEAADLSTGDIFADVNGFVDEHGSLIENGLAVLKDIINTFTPLNYSESFFNTTEWDAAQLNAANVVFSITDDEQEINDIIEVISLSLHGYFIVEDDGRYTFRYSDLSAPSVKTILPTEFLNQPDFNYKQGEYATSIVVLYDIDGETEKYRRVVENSNEEDIVLRYKQYKEEEFTTVLKDRNDAVTLSQNIASQYDEIKPQIQILTSNQHYDLKIGDIVDVGLYYEETRFAYSNVAWPETRYLIVYPVRCEVLGVEKDVQRSLCKLSLWFIHSNGYDLSNAKMVRDTLPSWPTFIGEIPYMLRMQFDAQNEYRKGDVVFFDGKTYYYKGD